MFEFFSLDADYVDFGTGRSQHLEQLLHPYFFRSLDRLWGTNVRIVCFCCLTWDITLWNWETIIMYHCIFKGNKAPLNPQDVPVLFKLSALLICKCVSHYLVILAYRTLYSVCLVHWSTQIFIQHTLFIPTMQWSGHWAQCRY